MKEFALHWGQTLSFKHILIIMERRIQPPGKQFLYWWNDIHFKNGEKEVTVGTWLAKRSFSLRCVHFILKIMPSVILCNRKQNEEKGHIIEQKKNHQCLMEYKLGWVCKSSEIVTGFQGEQLYHLLFSPVCCQLFMVRLLRNASLASF